MRVRRLTIADFEELRTLANICWSDTYKEIYKVSTIARNVRTYYSDKKLRHNLDEMRRGKGLFIVAVHSCIVGYAHVARRKDGWELLRIYVDPRSQRKGIGVRLLKRCESFLRENKVRSYIAHPHARNAEGIAFYLRLGFVRFQQGDRGRVSPCFRKMLSKR
ncbi:MAG: GNAT family N-acetyltransferase [Nanoarchaeota archaeon]